MYIYTYTHTPAAGAPKPPVAGAAPKAPPVAAPKAPVVGAPNAAVAGFAPKPVVEEDELREITCHCRCPTTSQTNTTAVVRNAKRTNRHCPSHVVFSQLANSPVGALQDAHRRMHTCLCTKTRCGRSKRTWTVERCDYHHGRVRKNAEVCWQDSGSQGRFLMLCAAREVRNAC